MYSHERSRVRFLVLDLRAGGFLRSHILGTDIHKSWQITGDANNKCILRVGVKS